MRERLPLLNSLYMAAVCDEKAGTLSRRWDLHPVPGGKPRLSMRFTIWTSGTNGRQHHTCRRNSTKRVKSVSNYLLTDCTINIEIEYEDLPENRWEKRHNVTEKRQKRSSLSRRVADKQIGKCICVCVKKSERSRQVARGNSCVYTNTQ